MSRSLVCLCLSLPSDRYSGQLPAAPRLVAAIRLVVRAKSSIGGDAVSPPAGERA
jgi:hypothetical protein